MTIKRETYLEMIRPFYDADVIKVITGVRRCGKSVLLYSIMEELLQQGVSESRCIYINFEDLDNEYIKTAQELNKEIKNRINSGDKYYLFLDEIQQVQDFEKALSSFRASLNVSIFVTGSNSTLLSGELATLLTGRTVEFEIFPFSYYEVKLYFDSEGLTLSEDTFFDYLQWGGFPLRFQLKTKEAVSRYISNLYESIINRDIVQGTSRFDKDQFRAISLYILANAGKEFSAENIANYYNAHNNKNISTRTIYNYLSKMKKAYLLQNSRRHYLSGKQALGSKEKYYAIDMGFRTINTNTIDYENTFFLENVFFNELRSRGYAVYTGKTYKSEIDFVVVKDGKKCFIQVAYYLASEKTIAREFGAFSPIRQQCPKYVFSLDKIDFSRNGIQHINIIDFLLRKKDIVLT